MANTSRRLQGPPPRLTRRSWEEVASELEDFLRKTWEGWADGIPPGYGGTVTFPTTIEAGDVGDDGTELSGWSAADHEHPVPVDAPAGLSNVAVEGTATTLVRSDHQHKRDVRVQENGGDVGTRNALDFVDGIVAFTVADDAGSDKVTIEGGLNDEYSTFSRGGAIVGATGAGNYIVWQAPYACTVLAVKGYRVGGGSATINARKNGSSQHLGTSLTISAPDVWEDGGTVQNTGYVVGDKLEIQIISLSAPLPTQVAIQVDLQRA